VQRSLINRAKASRQLDIYTRNDEADFVQRVIARLRSGGYGAQPHSLPFYARSNAAAVAAAVTAGVADTAQ
jgi:hypothetical protein